MASFKKFQSTKKLVKWKAERFKNWESIPKTGKLVPGTNLLPIKVPLSTVYEIHYTGTGDKSSFTPSELVEGLVADAQKGVALDIGMAIDATGTDSYFHDTKEWEDWDATYVKLERFSTEETESDTSFVITIPPPSAVRDFFYQVRKFTQAGNDDRHIAVFCSTGYNISGYLIVSYLVEICNQPLDRALDAFQVASPPGIYSRTVLLALYKKYHTNLSTNPTVASRGVISCPNPPAWGVSSIGERTDNNNIIGPECLTDADRANAFKPVATTAVEPSANDTASGATSTSRSKLPPPPAYVAPTQRSLPPPPAYEAPSRPPPLKKRRLRTWDEDTGTWPTDKYGGEIITKGSPIYNSVMSVLQSMTKGGGDDVIDHFPGTEAVSLSRSHLQKLSPDYLVTWRARGRRCLLLILKDGVYAISRNLSSITALRMRFPRKRNLSECQDKTLIDGVLVQDTVKGVVTARFLAFDIVFHEGSSVWKQKLDRRLSILQNEVIGPRKIDSSSNKQQYDYAKEPFRLRLKDHFSIKKTESVLKKFIPQVTHEVKGLIFTPTSAPYGLGGYEAAALPLFKFIEPTEAFGLDGSLSLTKLLEHIKKF